MDLTLTEDQELVATTAREFLEARANDADARAMEHDPAGYSESVWKEMVELGWPGLALAPEQAGGGGTFLDLCLLVEQMGAFQVPSPFVPTVVSALTIDRVGTGDQRSDWLNAVAHGEKILSYALPPTGSSACDVIMTESDGGYALTGTGAFVPFAHAAHDVIVIATPEGSDEPTAFLVDTANAGLRLEALDTVGHDRQARLIFEGAEVPAERVLGEVGGGADVVETLMAYGATATCAEMVGGAQRVLDMTVEYASEREQFGQPIGTFQAVQHHCADMAIDVLGSRFITYEAAWRLAEGLDADREVAMAKAWVSEAYQRVCALGHQVHGAIGFTREHDMHLFFRHCVAAELSFGDGDVHWDRIATDLGL